MRSIFAAVSLVLATPVAAAPDPLLTRIIAGARAASPDSIGFERTARTTSQDAGAAAQTSTRVERWDGHVLTPISIDGKPATADEVAKARKVFASRPVPGYHRIAAYLGNGARRIADPQGRTVYRIDSLPKDSITVGRDVSSDMAGEVFVETAGDQPYVSRLHLFLPKPVSFFMVAKLDALDVVYEYRPGPGGRPALVHTVQNMAGSQMGKAGTTRTDSTFTPLK